MEPREPIEPEGLFDGLRGVPILLSALIDYLATLLATGLLLGAVAPEIASGSFSQETADRLSASQPFLLGMLLIGTLCTVFAAFLGARMAGRLFVSHGGWIAVTGTVLSLVYLLPISDPAAASQPELVIPLWYEVLAWLLILPAGIAGGLLARAVSGGEPDPS